MKNRIWITCLAFILFLPACKKNEENRLEKNVKDRIKEEFTDITSIKIISFEKIDSISLRQSIEKEKFELDSFISYSVNRESKKDRQAHYMKTTVPNNDNIDYATGNRKSDEDEIRKNSEMVNYLDKIERFSDVDEPCIYTYFYRTETRMKSNDVNYITFLVIADYKDSIIRITRDPENMRTIPCKIPGYEDKYEMLEKEYNN
jgi:hypothetical protein